MSKTLGVVHVDADDGVRRLAGSRASRGCSSDRPCSMIGTPRWRRWLGSSISLSSTRAPRSWRWKFSTYGAIDSPRMLSPSMTTNLSPSTKFSASAERLGDAAGLLLVGVAQALQAELAPVAEQPQELAGVVAAGDDHDVVDAGLDQRLDRVVDHRLVVDRQQVLVGDAGQRVQAACRCRPPGSRPS